MFTRKIYCANCDKIFSHKLKKYEQISGEGKIKIQDTSKKYLFQEYDHKQMRFYIGNTSHPPEYFYIKNPLKRQAVIDSKKQYENDIKVLDCPNCGLNYRLKLLSQFNN